MPAKPIIQIYMEGYEFRSVDQEAQIQTQKTYWEGQGYEFRIGPRPKPHVAVP